MYCYLVSVAALIYIFILFGRAGFMLFLLPHWTIHLRHVASEPLGASTTGAAYDSGATTLYILSFCLWMLCAHHGSTMSALLLLGSRWVLVSVSGSCFLLVLVMSLTAAQLGVSWYLGIWNGEVALTFQLREIGSERGYPDVLAVLEIIWGVLA
jgi:hypothetical protein